MPLPRRTIKKNLESKGFKGVSATHHKYLHYFINEKKTAMYVYFSQGSSHREYTDNLIYKMKKTLKLDRGKQAFELADCTMNEETYKKILEDKKLI